MHGLINMSGKPWYRMEQDIARFLGDREGHMKVRVQYSEADCLRPHAFFVEVIYSNGMRSTWKTFNYDPFLSRPL